MTERSAHHATFAIERTYDAAPARVFDAWAKPETKIRWFAPERHGWTKSTHDVDFRVGGREQIVVDVVGGQSHAFDGRYWDIIPNQRIVYTYDMHLGGERMSVSLTTVEFRPVGQKTQLLFTEQVVFLDGGDSAAQRKDGTEELLESLGIELHRNVS